MTVENVETEQGTTAFGDELCDEALDRDDAAARGGAYTNFYTRHPSQ